MNVYPTYGVHNPPKYSPCTHPDCLYPRGPGEPSDPLYPLYWSAKWTMYRVYKQYAEFPPPYDGQPPEALVDGEDYQTSYGQTYYDSTWRGPNGEEGFMMEHYDDYSLPIFPIPNNFTSSFVSFGNTAYFITYEKDRPEGMPPVCLFSTLNHPPTRDFIKHLPYSKSDSQQLDNRIQGYSFWTGNNGPAQVGVSPVPALSTGLIMFGYAFYSHFEADSASPEAPVYRHPQSFYFSGYPLPPANAPIVSQNYTEFSMIKPDADQILAQVTEMAGGDLGKVAPCNLFGRKAKPKAKADALGASDKSDKSMMWSGEEG